MRYQSNSSILLQVQGYEFSFSFALITEVSCQGGSKKSALLFSLDRSEAVCDVKLGMCGGECSVDIVQAMRSL